MARDWRQRLSVVVLAADARQVLDCYSRTDCSTNNDADHCALGNLPMH